MLVEVVVRQLSSRPDPECRWGRWIELRPELRGWVRPPTRRGMTWNKTKMTIKNCKSCKSKIQREKVNKECGYGMLIFCPGLNPINKNLSSEKLSDKNLRILAPPIFSEILRNSQTKYFGAAGWTNFWKFSSEYFDRNTFWKSVEIVRILIIFSEFWELLCW